MNYTELFNTIKVYCENDFADSAFTNPTGDVTVYVSSEQVNTFIRQAEQRIYNSVQPPAIRKNVYGELSVGEKYLNLPDDFLSVYSLAVLTDPTVDVLSSPQTFLLNKDVNFIREAYPNPTDTGVPKYYALFGMTVGDNVPEPYKQYSLIVGPMPDLAYKVELHYYHYPESIVDAGSSWLGDNFDSVLLYGALLEAIVFMKGETDIATMYKARYDEAMGLYKQMGDGKERQDAYRSGQVRVPIR
jgi:hypothetical protein